jgi:hypothetical protein
MSRDQCSKRDCEGLATHLVSNPKQLVDAQPMCSSHALRCLDRDDCVVKELQVTK